MAFPPIAFLIGVARGRAAGRSVGPLPLLSALRGHCAEAVRGLLKPYLRALPWQPQCLDMARETAAQSLTVRQRLDRGRVALAAANSVYAGVASAEVADISSRAVAEARGLIRSLPVVTLSSVRVVPSAHQEESAPSSIATLSSVAS
jgi:hypothetical protein